jgi:hypothetical protein
MKESRTTERRRGFHSGQTFPFTSRDGGIIYADRRTRPDRRLANISLEVLGGPTGFAGACEGE